MPEPLREKLRVLIEQVGELEACRRLKMSRNAVYRSLAGLPVLEGTIALVERGE